jgi:ectoine hydroxylase-related dioxygenase (phytanoyl-CoA dioxygenase family)
MACQRTGGHWWHCPTTGDLMPSLAPHESLPMFAISAELAPRIEALGLQRNVEEMRENGYTVIENVASPAFFVRLRAAIQRCCAVDRGQYFNITAKGESADLLLDRDDVFAEAVLNEKLLAMMEFMCGRNPLLSQLSGSVRHQGAKAMPLHADQDWIPAPMPEHNAVMTGCFYCDDMNEAAGPTKVVPGSHLLRRQPTPDEVQAEAGAVPLKAPRYSIGLWDGRLWHSNYGRTAPGERVVLHATFCRLAYRPLEDYGHLGQDFTDRWGETMSRLLGRNLWFGNRAVNGGGVDMRHYGETWQAARR